MQIILQKAQHARHANNVHAREKSFLFYLILDQITVFCPVLVSLLNNYMQVKTD